MVTPAPDLKYRVLYRDDSGAWLHSKGYQFPCNAFEYAETLKQLRGWVAIVVETPEYASWKLKNNRK